MFVNRVQTVTQKHHRVENRFEKPSLVHGHPASPAGTPRCALARPGARMAALSWSGPDRVMERGRPCRRPQWLYRSIPVARPARFRQHPPRPTPQRQRLLAPRLLRAQRRFVGAMPHAPVPCRGCVCVHAWPYRGLPRDTVPSRLATLVTIQYVYCDTNAQSSSLPLLQYYPAYCNTILPYILQYNPRLTNCIAIQFPSLQYKLGSSKFPNFCTNFFFRFSL